MISIKNLTKIYQNGSQSVKALDNISLHIKKGEIAGIIGYSGAGKSSLVRCLNMLEKPTAGTITIDNREITSLSDEELRVARREIAMVFQHFNLLSSRTVFGNVAFPLEIAGVPKREIKQRVEKLLSLVGLVDKAAVYPAQLSGGQKQRVGIARALANDPKVLLCDEATSALDPETTKSILKLLKDINCQLDLTILIITHEMKVITEICDTVAVLENGSIIEMGNVVDVFTRPQHPTTRAFVQTVINTEIPEPVRQHIGQGGDGKVIRISFIGDHTEKPVISRIVKKFDVDANILYGNIDHLQDTPFGGLIIKLTGQQDDIARAEEYLAGQGLQIEVITNEH
ncbi:D-methionine transport system ATP-binding protein [Desulfohalotomaculum tongense]|uniref:methionine ABC transporter ATP-binding protein n=1 Tax=Desulforadius tongensis TaxID=1216062 RepID=UPI00195853CB|nr:methionine ABC transporter ATP-binding protein [Desulforadius tongensis]MBM7854039.1 D-methionine transport system ATP-binding protein [Desulforadius tongensis]